MFWPGIYGVSATVYFPLIDFGATDFESTPATFAAGDTQIIKDGGTAANATNTPAHEGNGIYSLVLTATEMEATAISITIIDQTATKLFEDQAIVVHTGFSHQLLALNAVEVYTVNTASTAASQTVFEADRGFGRSEESTADHFNGRNVFWLDPALQGQADSILDYSLQNARGLFTLSGGLTDTPVTGDQFLIL